VTVPVDPSAPVDAPVACLLPLPPAWPDAFIPFTVHHAVTAVVFGALAVGLVALAHRWKETPRGAALDGGIIGGMVVAQALMIVYWAAPARFDPGSSLPLHMCDLVGWMVPLAMLARSRPLNAVLFFWGLGLTTQAFIQPTLTFGIRHGVYWFFWIQHAGILFGALYIWIVRGFRPRWADFFGVAALGAVVGAITAFVNFHTGWEYFFTGPDTPGNPTILDRLGDWPDRVVFMWLIATGLMATLWGLSVAADRAIRRTTTDAGPPADVT